jgi:hypothetical protein
MVEIDPEMGYWTDNWDHLILSTGEKGEIR